MLRADKCIVCGNQELTEFRGEIEAVLKDRMFNDFDAKSKFLYCPQCHISFSEARPEDHEASRYYQNYMREEFLEHRKKYEGDSISQYQEWLETEAPKGSALKKKIVGEILEKNINLEKIENVLDYGGSDGFMIPDNLASTKRYVYEIDNIEPIAGVTKVGKNELNSKKWDLILCTEVLEHVSYPMKIIKELLELLHEGGYLYLDVPYEGKGSSSYVEDKQEPFWIHEHINKFRPITFDKIFNSYQYVILENSFMQFYDPAIVCSEGHIVCLVKKLKQDEKSEILKGMYDIKVSIRELQINVAEITNKINSVPITRIITENVHKPTFIQQIFSVTNEGNRKLLRILGFRIKIKRKIKS